MKYCFFFHRIFIYGGEIFQEKKGKTFKRCQIINCSILVCWWTSKKPSKYCIFITSGFEPVNLRQSCDNRVDVWLIQWFMDLWLLLILWLARRLRIWDSCLIQKRLRMLIFMVAKLFRVRERCLKNPNGIRTTNELKRCFAFIGRKEVWRPFYVKRWVIEEIFQEESQKRSNSCHKSKLSIRAWK